MEAQMGLSKLEKVTQIAVGPCLSNFKAMLLPFYSATSRLPVTSKSWIIAAISNSGPKLYYYHFNWNILVQKSTAVYIFFNYKSYKWAY